MDLSKFTNSPYLYILDKYKSIYEKVVSINEVKVLMLSVENGDVIWKNSIAPQTKRPTLYPQQQYVWIISNMSFYEKNKLIIVLMVFSNE